MEETARPGHEGSDLNPAKIFLFGAILLLAVIAAAVVSFLFLRYAAARRPSPQVASSAPARAREPAPVPRLQVKGSNELREMREAEERVLHSYAWIDGEKGIVRIPVERAMEILAEKEGARREAKGESRRKKEQQ
jgi:uncharacterized protein (DUF58 family)